MHSFPARSETTVDHDEFHEMQLVCKRGKDKHEDMRLENFEEDDTPELPKDPEGQKKVEKMTPENKQIILEIGSVVWLTVLFNG